MEKSSWRTRGVEWFTSHALWELAKELARVLLSILFAWLISLGLAHMIHAALGVAFNIFLILIGLIGLSWLFGFIPRLRRMSTQSDERQLALSELNGLITRGHRLLGDTPKNGATVSDFVRFWNEQMGSWSKAVGTILKDHWDKNTQDFFFSVTGLNMEQPLPQIYPESKMDYLYLARWLQNLEHLRQMLKSG